MPEGAHSLLDEGGFSFQRVSDYVFHYADRWPDREFAVWNDIRLSYRDAADQVIALSRALIAAGVRPGDRVATLSTPRPEFVIAALATTDVGAIWVGLNPKYRPAELSYLVDNSKPSILFSLTHLGSRDYAPEFARLLQHAAVKRLISIGGAMAGAETFEDFRRFGADQPDHARQVQRESAGGKNPAVIVYTSGSTGRPKGAMLSHFGMTIAAQMQERQWNISPPRTVCNLPINHIGCIGDIVCTTLAGGGTLVFMEQFDAAGVLATVAKERVKALVAVPTMYQLIAEHPSFDSVDLSSLRLVTWGGSAMPAGVLRRYRQRVDARMKVMYGLTEGCGTLTYSEVDASDEQLTASIGRPYDGVEIRLQREDGKACGPGEPGEIQVRHPMVFLGYLNNPDATTNAFTDDGFLRTGDLAFRRADGYLVLVGRLSDMFKSGGYNVYPREIELVIESHPSVAIAAVVGVPDAVFGEVGVALAVGRASADDLLEWCRERLANYKVPKRLELVDSLPMLPIGKVDKIFLRQQLLENKRI